MDEENERIYLCKPHEELDEEAAAATQLPIPGVITAYRSQARAARGLRVF